MSTLSATTMVEIEKVVRKAMAEGTAIASNIGHTDGHNFTVCITSDLGKALELERVANASPRKSVVFTEEDMAGYEPKPKTGSRKFWHG